MLRATRSVPGLQARLGLAADPFDLDRVRAEEADAIQDLADPPEIDHAALAEGREIPVLEPSSTVLEVDAPDQVLYSVQLDERVGPEIIVGDVAGIEVESDPRDGRPRPISSSMAVGVLGRPLVSLQRQVHPKSIAEVAQAPEVPHYRGSFVDRGRRDRPAEIASREPEDLIGGEADTRGDGLEPGRASGDRPRPRCHR